MFKTKNVVRMHDTDMAGILYFGRQFRFVHDALEEFFAHIGHPLDQVFRKNEYVFVIVHCEADYHAPLRVGDPLEVSLWVEQIGKSSFTVAYTIHRTSDGVKVGSAKTVHVTLDRITWTKIAIPTSLRLLLESFLV